jgi:hypothetical protein
VFFTLLAASAILLAGQPAASAQTALGSIEGVVVDTDNAPVAGATVYPVSGPAGTGRSHAALTNADGRFRIEQMVPGTYKLSAFKVEDGYADTAIPFYEQPEHPLTSVTVSSATENADLSIQLGARCGILHIDLSDAVSHNPITSGVLVMQQRNLRSAVLQGDKSFPGDFLVPPVDVSVEISRAGYTNWHLSQNGHDYVTLRPGEHHTVHAEVQPTAAK